MPPVSPLGVLCGIKTFAVPISDNLALLMLFPPVLAVTVLVTPYQALATRASDVYLALSWAVFAPIGLNGMPTLIRPTKPAPLLALGERGADGRSAFFCSGVSNARKSRIMLFLI
ncbi:hypothetical protein [Sodalis sp.]|uniref:hypothetical protein n=1 Tax=Sodalis sp. (in: enterobacteria) TaxID=1898979 RepID=UPI003872BE2B